MKRLVILCFLFCSVVAQAQDMKSLFVALPDSLAPLLTEVNRADFGDFLSSNMKAEVKNRFGRSSEMLRMTDDFLQLKMTSVSSAEMKLLPVNDSTKVICVVRTYRGPVPDSEVRFYSTDWKELPLSDYFRYPEKDSFFLSQTLVERQDSLNRFKQMADMYLLKICLSEDKQEMYLTFTTPDFLDKNTMKHYASYLRKEPCCYRWEKGRFEQVK